MTRGWDTVCQILPRVCYHPFFLLQITPFPLTLVFVHYQRVTLLPIPSTIHALRDLGVTSFWIVTETSSPYERVSFTTDNILAFVFLFNRSVSIPSSPSPPNYRVWFPYHVSHKDSTLCRYTSKSLEFQGVYWIRILHFYSLNQFFHLLLFRLLLGHWVWFYKLKMVLNIIITRPSGLN